MGAPPDVFFPCSAREAGSRPMARPPPELAPRPLGPDEDPLDPGDPFDPEEPLDEGPPPPPPAPPTSAEPRIAWLPSPGPP
jgi:hypothetical protein